MNESNCNEHDEREHNSVGGTNKLAEERSNQILHFFSLHHLRGISKEILDMKELYSLAGLSLLDRVHKLVRSYFSVLYTNRVIIPG